MLRDSSSPINYDLTPISQESHHLSHDHPSYSTHPCDHRDPSSCSNRMLDYRYVLVDSILVIVDSHFPLTHTDSQYLHLTESIPSHLPFMSYKLQGSNVVPAYSFIHSSSSTNVYSMQTISKSHSLQALLTSIDSSDELVNNEPKSIHQVLLSPLLSSCC